MESTELLSICAVSFLMVFVILMFLAVIMRFIILIFPEKVPQTEAAVVAAVTAAVQSIFPGTKVTKIEEQK